ncbi:unnamed protein product [Blepharisma stoltei]|uniref:Ribosome recycling factor domain-containing protein n=1 Tax=Blepharisma stoltei TaxID=1481888 RepID=A0AAU9JF02_9CILI|nr:unnamed protein product [Blepharisma stoltei]
MAFRLARLFRTFSFSYPLHRLPPLSYQPVRFFASKKKGKDNDKKGKGKNRNQSDEEVDEEFDIEPIKKDMAKPLKHFEECLQRVTLSRGDPRIFDELYVTSKHDNLSNLAQVAMRNASEVSIKPFDAANTDAIITAIQAANLNVNCRKEGSGTISVSIPKPTKEMRNELIKQAKQYLEETKNSIRNRRTHALSQIKDITSIGEDDVKNLQKEVQKIHDSIIKKAEEMLAAKEKAINQG